MQDFFHQQYLLDCQEICDNYSIIAYYFQRPAMNEKFAQRVTKFNENSIPEEVYKMNRHLEYMILLMEEILHHLGWLKPFK